jgi:hypothetical protein
MHITYSHLSNARIRIKVLFVSSQMLCGFKIIIRLKSNNNHLKFNDDFKNYMIFEKTQ